MSTNKRFVAKNGLDNNNNTLQNVADPVNAQDVVTKNHLLTTLTAYGLNSTAIPNHIADASLHLTSAQNTWLDAITATSAEVNYLSGVTSAIQTQINAKLASSSYTAADVLAKLTTVDGSSSGLDADLLDGLHASSFFQFGTAFKEFRANIEWSGVIEWRKIATVVEANSAYSATRFRIEILDATSNYGNSNALTNKLVFNVTTCRAGSTTLNSPDVCYVSGPDTSHCRAVKVSTGNYEIQIGNATIYDQCQVSIQVIADNATSTVTYFDGSTVGSTGTVYTADTQVGCADYFSGDINARVIASRVPQGTAPFSLTSTTVNPNLNADLLDGYHASEFALVSGANSFTGTITTAGQLTVNKTTSDAVLQLNANAGYYKYLSLTTAGSSRWSFGSSNAAESGSNAGSNLFIQRHDDAGVYIDTPFQISRSTGTTTLSSLTITGDLTINGTTTTINATTVTVDDKNIELGSVTTPTNATADGGGITLKGTTDKTIIWDTANTNWTSSENWNLASGKVFKINNTQVLSSTTLGSTVTSSSLTSVGTLTGLNISGQITSTLAIGTAPFNVTSTTVNTNLNADLLDGYHASSFLRSDAAISLGGRLSLNSYGFQISTKDDITTRVDAGFWQTATATTAEGWPENTNDWWHLISNTHTNDVNYYSMQFAASFYDSNKLYYRTTNNLGTTSWNKIWHAGNDGSGSGLDADLLDGLHSTDFARFSSVHTTSNPDSALNGLSSGDANIDGTLKGWHWLTSTNSRAGGYGVQLAFSDTSLGSTYLRTKDTGTWGSWTKIWNASNDGTGSGLDADLLDGLDSSKFLQFGTAFKEFRANIEWNGVIEWRKIATVAEANSAYASTRFRVEILDATSNYGSSNANTNKLVYNITTCRSGSTTLNSPDVCYVSGPAVEYCRAVKTSAGNYEIQIGNYNIYDQCQVSIQVIADNATSTVTYFDGSTVGSTGTAYTADTQVGCSDYFSGDLNARVLTSRAAQGTAPFSINSTTRCGNLNSDLLDGYHATSFLRSDSSTTWNGSASGVFQITMPTTASGDYTSQINTLQVYQGSASYDSFITFHIAAAHACHFGLDHSTNDLFVGGWSKGANKYKIWHAANHGSGSGLNADLLDGYHASSFAQLSGATFTGNLTIGTNPYAYINLRVSKALTGYTSAYGISIESQIQSDVIDATGHNSYLSVASGAALNYLRHYYAYQATFTGTVVNQMGFHAHSTLIGATNNYGFYSEIASGTGRYNFYAAGTAANYFAGTISTPSQIISTLATGTAPFSISSSTVCPNLNADLLDGHHADTAYDSFGSGTVPIRHTFGYLFSNYFNCTASWETTTPSGVAIQTNSDNFIRWQTYAQFTAGRQAADSAPANAATVTIDCSTTDYIKITPAGASCTIAVSNWPTGTFAVFVEGVNFGAKTITWPTGIKWAGGSAPAFTSSGSDLISIFRNNAGVIIGSIVTKDFR